jgi:hypothetical protein
MPFPLSITQKFYIPEDFVKTHEIDLYSAVSLVFGELERNHATDLIRKGTDLRFRSEKSLFAIPFDSNIKFQNDEFGIFLTVESQMLPFIRIILAVIVFSALLSLYSVISFIIFAPIFIFLFYTVNVIVIQNNNEKFFAHLFGVANFDFDSSEAIERRQKEWLKDVNRCPACGTFVSTIDYYCPECGLKVKQNISSMPLNITKYQNRIVKYIYTKK